MTAHNKTILIAFIIAFMLVLVGGIYLLLSQAKSVGTTAKEVGVTTDAQKETSVVGGTQLTTNLDENGPESNTDSEEYAFQLDYAAASSVLVNFSLVEKNALATSLLKSGETQPSATEVDDFLLNAVLDDTEHLEKSVYESLGYQQKNMLYQVYMSADADSKLPVPDEAQIDTFFAPHISYFETIDS